MSDETKGSIKIVYPTKKVPTEFDKKLESSRLNKCKIMTTKKMMRKEPSFIREKRMTDLNISNLESKKMFYIGC